MSEAQQVPRILSSSIEVSTDHFKIEKLHLRFSNGVERFYERMLGSNCGAVMMVPVLGDHLLLVKEYCAGTNSYELGFPKGKIDSGETWMQAAQRELQEEIGYLSNKITFLRSVNSAPSFFQGSICLLLAEDLIPSVLDTGDEPEPLDVISYPIAKVKDLLTAPDFQEARCLAALACAISLKNW